MMTDSLLGKQTGTEQSSNERASPSLISLSVLPYNNSKEAKFHPPTTPLWDYVATVVDGSLTRFYYSERGCPRQATGVVTQPSITSS